MLGPLIFSRPEKPGGLILVEHEAMQLVESFRQRDVGASEAGGILIGFRRGDHLQVVEATPPQATDQRRRTSFRRSSKGHAEIARRRWEETAGTADYLGEWHTHPEDRPSPSGLDRREWQAIIQTQGRAMLFLIAGRCRAHWFGVATSAGIVCLGQKSAPSGTAEAAPDHYSDGSLVED